MSQLRLKLISSDALLFEIGRIPYHDRKDNALAILNQFSVVRGDYKKEREDWLGDISLDDAISEIKAEKKKTQPSE